MPELLLDAISNDYCIFHLDEECFQVPDPDYQIGNIISEHSFNQLDSIMDLYRKRRNVEGDELTIGVINYEIEKNYFGWGNGNNNAVISVAGFNQANLSLTLTQYIINAIALYAVSLIEQHNWHRDPRRCFYDFCGDKRDIASRKSLCDTCARNLSNAAKKFLAVVNFEKMELESRSMNKVLFVSADPSDASRLGVQREVRDIKAELQQSVGRDRFVFDICLAARPSDLSRSLLAKPRSNLLHFSGHGTSKGAICLENDALQVAPVPSAALASLLKPISSDLSCVVLNACFSSKQAPVILEHVPFVIGMSSSIKDSAAIAYSVGFYQAIFSGEEIPVAHEFGCAQVHMVLEGEQEKIELLQAS